MILFTDSSRSISIILSASSRITKKHWLRTRSRWSRQSSIRPGVPITISTPRLIYEPCSWTLLPPTTTIERSVVSLVSFWNSISICCASSLVGAIIKPYGPFSASYSFNTGIRSRKLIMGRRNAQDLPEPVGAKARRSRI